MSYISLFVGTNAKDIPEVQPLRTEWRNDTTESKNTYPTKEADVKIMTEAKKKLTMDFKVKNDQKYQKPIAKDDDSKKLMDSDTMVTSSISPTTSSSTKIDQPSTTISSMNITNVVPLLLHGEPIVVMTRPMPTSNATIESTINDTEEAQVTEETISSRGRALNISAPEPTNSLHANITDLSDVSMDEDDKEVEGKH
jgi:hypothetical protein